MGKLIVVVGSPGVGKTTFTQALCQHYPFHTGLEQHEERPFQKLFALDLHKYALANQVDYLLFRAEQELAIRKSRAPGIQDGGLDEDFHVFTRHFYQKGYLPESEYRLCKRTYTLLRQVLPPPDLIVWLDAPLEVIAGRYARRSRPLEIARREDLQALETLVQEWMSSLPAAAVIRVDASLDDPTYTPQLEQLIPQIETVLVHSET